MRIVFFGTPPYVLPVLEALHKHFKQGNKTPIAAVVTQAPKPTGRKQLIEYSEIDHWAHKRGVPKFYRAEDILKNNIQADIGVLAALGQIIPKSVIDHFRYGILNVHPSLLPKFRGASPVQATITSGVNQTGATIITIDELLDHGPIISYFKEGVRTDDTTESLRNRLFERSADVLPTLITAYTLSKTKPKEQDHNKATFTTMLKKDHGFIPEKYLNAALQGLTFKGQWEIPFMKDFSMKPEPKAIERFVRAMQPWPVAWTHVKLGNSKEMKRLKIHSAHLEGIKLVLDEVQLEGKTKVDWIQFKQAYPESDLGE